MSNDKGYKLIVDGKHKVEHFFQRFYVIPKDINLNDVKPGTTIKEFLELHSLNIVNEEIKQKTYIVMQGKKPKRLNQEQIQIIKDSDKSQRALAKEFNCSVGTINKVKNNKY